MNRQLAVPFVLKSNRKRKLLVACWLIDWSNGGTIDAPRHHDYLVWKGIVLKKSTRQFDKQFATSDQNKTEKLESSWKQLKTVDLIHY